MYKQTKKQTDTHTHTHGAGHHGNNWAVRVTIFATWYVHILLLLAELSISFIFGTNEILNTE